LAITVKDVTAPVVTVPANITEVGVSGTTVTYSPAPSATDMVDGTSDVVTCSPASGHAFPQGTTTVTCSTTDTNGNTGSATFTVTIDSVAPSSANSNVSGTVATQLSITAGAAVLGPFLPGIGATYTGTATASVTSTDSTTTLTIADTNTNAATAGHLINPAGPGYALPTAIQADASSTSHLATGSAFAPLSATPMQILSYSGPVTNDTVTVGFSQAIGAADILHNGTYGATVVLQLGGTA
jgi:hypothetical protein